MDYDFRTEPPLYNSSSSPSSHQMYPKIASHGHAAARPSHPHHSSPPSSSPGLGIRVFIKPEYRITPPPHLLPHSGDIQRSNFQFDFGLERKVLSEANKEKPNWSKFGMENLQTKVMESASPKVSVSDPIVSKYIAMGLNREAVPIAVANYGDNPTKIPEFVNSYTPLREMGFSSTAVAEALVMYDNDTDKALSHFLNATS
ncbi:uncharacterized protein LOC124835809 [Vigna umbellata]|uniref:UBA domain-containing protein n=2 Tax=Phaseolus angularis TaxID=3914 RepID=A0A0L9V050_PHAAN|nr:uncharacterized protein LOC108338719 [Vigna angularis]XP_047166764.1 uncharacterized protein LOC124835809 [Vigna umbellata]KOM48149.1 hypothetical protein LR48_Vigan07g185300 [Vigna angularis]BAT82035.1 hypothetical protein VIGAN_03197500 [Vigna angularis var. angularis]